LKSLKPTDPLSRGQIKKADLGMDSRTAPTSVYIRNKKIVSRKTSPY